MEETTLAELRENKARTEAVLQFYWEHYAELAFERQKTHTELLASLRNSCLLNFEFKHWQRAVKYKYCLHPLSTVGSLSDPGGRFNIGDLNPDVPQFPALYLAEDKETALQEVLGQPAVDSRLDSMELALTNKQSISLISLSGRLDRVFDLREAGALGEFVNIIKHFKFSKELAAAAAALGLAKPQTLRDVEAVWESLLAADWRNQPALFDVPANPQIFGSLLYQAGIEGVVYPSKLNGKACLAMFPRRFAQSNSYVELDDEVPHPCVPKRVDETNWKVCELTPHELTSGGD